MGRLQAQVARWEGRVMNMRQSGVPLTDWTINTQGTHAAGGWTPCICRCAACCRGAMTVPGFATRAPCLQGAYGMAGR